MNATENVSIWVDSSVPADERERLLASLRLLGNVQVVTNRADPQVWQLILTGMQLVIAGTKLASVLIEWKRECNRRGVDSRARVEIARKELQVASATDEEIRRWLSR